MRELAKSMECNQKLINRLGYSCRGRGSSLFDKWTSIRDYETAKKMLSETTIENIADEIGLIGTAYFLTEQCKSVKYHSIAHELESILGDMFYCIGIRNCIKVSILDVREKKLGYDQVPKQSKCSEVMLQKLCCAILPQKQQYAMSQRSRQTVQERDCRLQVSQSASPICPF